MHNSAKRNIGILTFHRGQSYGAVLQAYALQEVLSSLFPDAQVGIIDFQPECFRYECKRRSHYKRQQVFNSFIDNYLHLLTSNSSSLQQCLDSPVEGTITDIVVGSDQVWNPILTKGSLNDFLLGYRLEGIRKYSYAASFGMDTMNLSKDTEELFREKLKNFKALSVRESSALALCQRFGSEDVKVVLDPTLLAPPHIFESLQERTSEAIVCGFFLTREDYQRTFIRLLAKTVGISTSKIVFLGTKRPFFSFWNHVRFPSVEAFVSYIRSSKYVVTDSFHGVCFALRFHKELMVLPSLKFPERFCRINDLLSHLGLGDRILYTWDESTVGRLVSTPIDYETVDGRLALLRQQSLDFLQKSFK